MRRIKKALHRYIQEDILPVILNNEFGLQRAMLKKQLEKDDSWRQAEMFGYFFPNGYFHFQFAIATKTVTNTHLGSENKMILMSCAYEVKNTMCACRNAAETWM